MVDHILCRHGQKFAVIGMHGRTKLLLQAFPGFFTALQVAPYQSANVFGPKAAGRGKWCKKDPIRWQEAVALKHKTRPSAPI